MRSRRLKSTENLRQDAGSDRTLLVYRDCGHRGARCERWCGNCGRQLDGRASTVPERAERHVRRLASLGVSTRGHGPGCIERDTGGWVALSPANHNHQTCPCCGRTECHGSHCSGGGVPMGANDWHPADLSEARSAALSAGRLKAAHPGQKGPRSHGKSGTAQSLVRPAREAWE